MTQCAEITRMASGRRRDFPNELQAAVKRLGSMAYIGLPWPTKIAGWRWLVIKTNGLRTYRKLTKNVTSVSSYQCKQNCQARCGTQHDDQRNDFLVDFILRFVMPFVHAKSSIYTFRLMMPVIIHYRPRPAFRIMPFPPPNPA